MSVDPLTGHEYADLPTRVSKAQVDAVVAALTDNLRLLQTGNLAQAAANIAEAVVTANDTKPSYVVLVADNGGTSTLAYGPYAGVKTAKNAADSGTMGTADPAYLYGILPLLKAPRRGHRTTKRKPK
jgi:hypothetical protein